MNKINMFFNNEINYYYVYLLIIYAHISEQRKIHLLLAKVMLSLHNVFFFFLNK